MPTPFYHLNIAQEVIERQDIPTPIINFVCCYWGEFLLGNVAPDVQVISGQTRQSTHFFDLPLKNNREKPWSVMLAKYPQLRYGRRLSSELAAFIAGYLCHLKADWLWVRTIFIPVFGLKSGWESVPQRLYLHNVLRAYIDQRTLRELNHDLGNHLLQSVPDQWLPFIKETDLCEWRDFLAGQLQPGGKISTVEVFAKRQGIAPEEYYRMIDSEETMEREIFSHLPRQSLDEYHDQILIESQKTLIKYLKINDP